MKHPAQGVQKVNQPKIFTCLSAERIEAPTKNKKTSEHPYTTEDVSISHDIY